MRTTLLAVAMTAALAASAAAQTPAPAAAPAPFRCPASIMVEESPVAPAGTRAAPGRSEHRFRGVDFFEGEYGDRSGAMASDSDRRPGNVMIQTFVFDERRPRNVYGRCAYSDTEAAVYVDVPRGVNRCTLVFRANPRTGTVGATQRPQQVDCR
jgi:hypothetical protein